VRPVDCGAGSGAAFDGLGAGYQTQVKLGVLAGSLAGVALLLSAPRAAGAT
jgi:hypothetical protein